MAKRNWLGRNTLIPDGRPASQRSKYDFAKGTKMEYGKKPPAAEQCEPGAVQGCGNPACPICLPTTGIAGGGALAGDGIMRAAFSRFSDQITRAIRQSDGRIMFTSDGPDFVLVGGAGPAEDPAIAAKRAAQDAERDARKPIEQFLLKAPLQVAWDDIVGNEDAHRAMVEAIEFPVKHRELFEFYAKRPTKGILLAGPPGCGKTMLGKAAAHVLGQLYGTAAPALLSVKATELQKPFVGQTEDLIRKIFAYARAYKTLHGHQLVVFIDEADAILPSRDGIGSRRAMPWEESNVSTFLTEMDGLEESGALVILATNRPHAIDAALLRDGRCDRRITVRRPTQHAARIIFARCLEAAPTSGDKAALVDFAMYEFFSPLRHLLKIKTAKGIDFLTLGHTVSGAMMVGLVERAKANAFHRDIDAGTQTGITEADMLAAIDALAEESRGKPDFYALQDLAEHLGVEFIELQPAKPEIKFTATATETLQ